MPVTAPTQLTNVIYLFQPFKETIMARSNIKKSSDYIIKTFDVKRQYTPIATKQGADTKENLQPPPFILGFRGAPTIRVRTKAE